MHKKYTFKRSPLFGPSGRLRSIEIVRHCPRRGRYLRTVFLATIGFYDNCNE